MLYGVLKGQAKDFKRDDDQDPHSELLILSRDKNHRIAINVRSSRGPQHQRLVEYLLLEDIEHPVLDFARTLKEGFTELKDRDRQAHGIDYIRNNMFRAEDMQPLVHTQPGPDNDLFEKVESLVERALSANATLYAFGEKWGPEQDKPDAYWEFLPGSGIHKIHMNQGDRQSQNAKYQDGALFVEFPSGRTTGLFIKFQNQAWHTDEINADPIPDAPNAEPIEPAETGEIEPWDVVPDQSPYHLARIVGALVNPAGTDEGHELVTIFNTSSTPLNLKGWKLLDTFDREEELSGTVRPAHAITIQLKGDGARLSNAGGTITLIDPRGLKVDGVSYSKNAARAEGRALTF